MKAIKELRKFGQSVYLDEISRSMLENGHLEELIKNEGIRGVTSNPAIFEKAIAQSNDYDQAIAELALLGNTADEIYETLVLEDIRKTADFFREMYDESQGQYGYVSLEVSPLLANDAEATIAEARHLWQSLNRPNVFIKVPSTKAGLIAIEELISNGINVNVTLIFGLERYRDVARAYINGLNKRLEQNQSIKNVASVASFFLSRIDVKLDEIFAQKAPSLAGKAAVASSKAAYQIYKRMFSEEFARLEQNGARPQRLLWASTGTKNPDYNDLLYVETVIGENTVNTMPPKTLEAFLDHGVIANTIENDLDETNQILKEIADLGIDMDNIAQELEDEGVAKFVTPFDSLMATIESARLKARANNFVEKSNPVKHEVLNAVKKRWSPRAFAPRSVSKEDILTMLEAARWAASAFNEQPWRFIVASKNDSQKYAKLLSCLREGNQNWAENAPVLMLAICKKTYSNTGGENKLSRYDLGQAVSALVLQASELDIYAHQMAGIYADKAKEAYNLSDEFEAVTAIALGYLGNINQLPDDLQAREKAGRIRKTMAEITIETDI